MSIEERIDDRFRSAAAALDVSVPAFDRVLARLARRRRRRAAAGLGATGVVVVGALFVVTSRPTDPPPSSDRPASHTTITTPPATVGPESTPADAVVGPGVTLAVTGTEPAAGIWSRLDDNDLNPRQGHAVVSTGSGLFVWGGHDGDVSFVDGAYYDSATGSWRRLPPSPLPPQRSDAVAVWTGTEVVVMNGVSENVKAAAFDPATFTWRTLDDPAVDNAANGSSKAVVVDGKVTLFSVFEDGAAPENQVAVLDPSGANWTVATPPPVPLDSGVRLVATGSTVIAVGTGTTAGGCWTLRLFEYAPSTDTWRELPAGPVSDRSEPLVVWTGTELFVGGGATCANGVASHTSSRDGALLDLDTLTWRPTAEAPASIYASWRFPDVWTGTSVAALSETGAPIFYSPTTDRWHLGLAPDAAFVLGFTTTPVVALDGSIVLAGAGIRDSNQSVGGVYVYTPPSGF